MSDKPQILGPVQKLQFLASAAGMPFVSRAQLAILVTLADMANASTGLAWPSFSTLAARSGTTARHAKTATKGLIEAGLIVVQQQGNRIRSNRYRLNPMPQEITHGSVTQITIQGCDLEDTRLVIPSGNGNDPQSTKVVFCEAPKSINQSEHKAKIDDRAISEVDAAPSRPEGPSGLHPTSRTESHEPYREFWLAMPMRTTVADAETRITEYLENGVIYADIVAGAKRYSAYCNTTTSPRRQSALAWLNRQAWRDDWTPPAPKGPAKAQESPGVADKAKTKTKTKTKTKEARQITPEFAAWNIKYEVIFKSRHKAYILFDNHCHEKPSDRPGPYNEKCGPCNNVRVDEVNKRPHRTLCCEIGKPLFEYQNEQIRQLKSLDRIRPKKYLTT